MHTDRTGLYIMVFIIMSIVWNNADHLIEIKRELAKVKNIITTNIQLTDVYGH